MQNEVSENFIIRAENGQIELTIDEVFDFPEHTCFWGGYDTFSTFQIISSGYYAKGQIPISTGEIFNFYEQLKECNNNLEGKAVLKSYEGNLEMTLIFDGKGHIRIRGIFIEKNHIDNKLIFELNSDQTYLQEPLSSLKRICSKYGDNRGVRQ